MKDVWISVDTSSVCVALEENFVVEGRATECQRDLFDCTRTERL